MVAGMRVSVIIGGMAHKEFWDREYRTSEHLALSTTHSEDLEKFCRYLIRHYKFQYLNEAATALDLGCGNGRNLIFLAENFGIRGTGFDISDVAIEHAVRQTGELPIQYEVRSIAETLPVADEFALS
jgi:SAM-dependent methyltransferase